MESIWTGLDLYVQMYSADPVTGEPSDGAQLLLHYCYFQNCSLYGGVNWVQRAGFGNPVRNLESEDEWDLFTLKVSHFYFKKTELDITNIFNRDVVLYLEMWLLGAMSGEGGKDDELHVLKKARAASFRLDFSDNQNAEGEANFIAPIYLQPAGEPVFHGP